MESLREQLYLESLAGIGYRLGVGRQAITNEIIEAPAFYAAKRGKLNLAFQATILRLWFFQFCKVKQFSIFFDIRQHNHVNYKCNIKNHEYHKQRVGGEMIR